MKKVKKGNYGYIRYQRKKRLLVTLVMFAIPLVIYVTGYIQTKTRLNLFTFVAILGCLPASRSDGRPDYDFYAKAGRTGAV